MQFHFLPPFFLCERSIPRSSGPLPHYEPPPHLSPSEARSSFPPARIHLHLVIFFKIRRSHFLAHTFIVWRFFFKILRSHFLAHEFNIPPSPTSSGLITCPPFLLHGFGRFQEKIRLSSYPSIILAPTRTRERY